MSDGSISPKLSRLDIPPTSHIVDFYLHQLWLASAKEYGQRLVVDSIRKGKTWQNMRLDGTDFSDSALRQVLFWKASLKNANFTGAELSGVVFEDCELAGANFSGARLTDVSFGGSNYKKADFSGTDTAQVSWTRKGYSFLQFPAKPLTL